MSIESVLSIIPELSKWLDDSVHGLQIPSGDREAMTGSLFDQVHEHHIIAFQPDLVQTTQTNNLGDLPL